MEERNGGAAMLPEFGKQGGQYMNLASSPERPAERASESPQNSPMTSPERAVEVYKSPARHGTVANTGEK